MLGPITNLWGPNIFKDPGPMILNFYHWLYIYAGKRMK